MPFRRGAEAREERAVVLAQQDSAFGFGHALKHGSIVAVERSELN